MPLASDGYATGFAIYVARQAGVPAEDKRLQRGIAWLKAHQRVSGRWFTPSLGFHRQHLISNAGTAYAVLALAACGEISRAKPAKREPWFAEWRQVPGWPLGTVRFPGRTRRCSRPGPPFGFSGRCNAPAGPGG